MHEKDPVAIDNVTLMHFHFELFFILLDHYDSVKIYESSRPEVINVECVYETCLHGVTLVPTYYKLIDHVFILMLILMLVLILVMD